MKLATAAILVSTFAQAELTYFCSKFGVNEDLTLSENEYKECGNLCKCKAIETLCISQDESDFKLDLVTFDYVQSCQEDGCICNTNTS